jgi:hypothetical protein
MLCSKNVYDSQKTNCIPFVDDVKVCHCVINGTNFCFYIQMMRKIGIRYERSMEIDIRNFIGDSLTRHGGIWICGCTAPLILNSELDNRKG